MKSMGFLYYFAIAFFCVGFILPWEIGSVGKDCISFVH
jgi:hypothetical protein